MTSSISTSPVERNGPTRIWTTLVEFVQPVLAPFLLSRFCVLVTAVLLEWLLDSGRAFRYDFIGQAPLATLSATFDANWYGDIAANGYSTSPDVTIQQNYQFRPLYPLLMRVLGMVLGLDHVQGGYNIAGVLLSHIFFLAALALFYWLTVDYWGDATIAKYSVWTMALLPWAFVFSMTYTEALFLLISLAAMSLAFWQRHHPGLGAVVTIAVLIACAALTRPQGVILVLPAILLVAMTPRTIPKVARLRNAAIIIIAAVAAGAGFMVYVGMITGNAWSSLQVNSTWGRGWLHDMTRLLVLPPANPAWSVDVITTTGLFIWLYLLIRMLQKTVDSQRTVSPGPSDGWSVRWAFPIYSVAYFVFTAGAIPMNTSWGRYMLVVFPCVWVVAAIAQRLTKRISAKVLLSGAVALQMLLFSSAIILQVTP
ncbi:MAG: mannosyltransferase family protein [Chloroflexota bacterium]